MDRAQQELIQGYFLSNLNEDREAGDYDALSYLDEETAHRAVQEAEEFVAAVNEYVSGLTGK